MKLQAANLALRFILELCAVLALAYWGWTRSEGLLRFILAFGLPLVVATIWGIFNVPGDPSRSGNAPVPVPGLVRLILEFVIFGVGVLALYGAGLSWAGLIFGIVVVIHYALSYKRVAWLLKQ